MIYIKYGNQEIPVDELLTRCFHCGKEVSLSSSIIRLLLENDCDLYSTQISCCSIVKPTLMRIK